MNAKLCTPQDWSNISRRRAMDCLGTPEAADFLADAKKFEMCHQVIQDLQSKLAVYKTLYGALERPVPAILKGQENMNDG